MTKLSSPTHFLFFDHTELGLTRGGEFEEARDVFEWFEWWARPILDDLDEGYRLVARVEKIPEEEASDQTT